MAAGRKGPQIGKVLLGPREMLKASIPTLVIKLRDGQRP